MASVLDNATGSGATDRSARFAGLDDVLIDIFREGIRDEMWEWFFRNRERPILKVSKLWIFSFTVRVKHIHPIFVLLFGEPNAELQQGE